MRINLGALDCPITVHFGCVRRMPFTHQKDLRLSLNMPLHFFASGHNCLFHYLSSTFIPLAISLGKIVWLHNDFFKQDSFIYWGKLRCVWVAQIGIKVTLTQKN